MLASANADRLRHGLAQRSYHLQAQVSDCAGGMAQSGLESFGTLMLKPCMLWLSEQQQASDLLDGSHIIVAVQLPHGNL